MSLTGDNPSNDNLINTLGLSKTSRFKFWLFRLGLINAEAKTATSVCNQCGGKFQAIETFSGGQSEGLQTDCRNCLDADRDADKAADWIEYQRDRYHQHNK